MRSLRLAAAVLAFALIAAACSDDDGEDAADDDSPTTTTQPVTTTTQPLVTTPTTLPAEPPTTTVVVDETEPTPTTTQAAETTVSVAAPTAPSNVQCRAGSAENELMVEFDAFDNPSDIATIRVYVSVDGGPMITNGEFEVGQIDTARSNGTRWAAPARSLPAGVPLRLTATSFNQLGQESGWYIVEGSYTGPGASCGSAGEPAPVLPPPTCSAGCDEEGFGQGNES